MKIWVTRPELTTLLSRGISYVDLWIVQPTFNTNARGERDMAIFATLPIGWEVIDPHGINITDQCCVRENKLLDGWAAVRDALWDAIVMDVDGQLPDGQEYRRWLKRLDDKTIWYSDKTGKDKFCAELDVPPDLWFRIALKNGWERQTFAGAHYQATFDAFDYNPADDNQYQRLSP